MLQLRAIHCLCASAVLPRCIDAIGTAAVTYIPFLFTKLEGLVKEGVQAVNLKRGRELLEEGKGMLAPLK